VTAPYDASGTSDLKTRRQVVTAVGRISISGPRARMRNRGAARVGPVNIQHPTLNTQLPSAETACVVIARAEGGTALAPGPARNATHSRRAGPRYATRPGLSRRTEDGGRRR